MKVRKLNQSGFTLIELMVALTLSLIMLGGISVIYVSTQKTGRIQDGLQQLNESGRFAIEMLSRDLRMSGYYGCSEDDNPMDDAGPVVNNIGGNYSVFPLSAYEHSTSGANAVWHPDIYSVDENNKLTADGPPPVTNSDMIIVRMASLLQEDDGDDVVITNNVQSQLDDIVISDSSALSNGDFMMIGNCEQADIFKASDVNGATHTIKHETNVTGGINGNYSNNSDSISNVYDSTANVYKFYAVRYEVKLDPSNNSIPTLFRQVNDQPEEAMIPGVESLQLQYGVDTGGTLAPDTLVQAHEVTNWSAVRTIKVSLLMRTEEEFGYEDFDRNDFPVTVAGNSFLRVGDYLLPKDDDRVRRRVFQTTINVRNST